MTSDIKEKNKTVLFTGCSHKGIKNIIEQAKIILGTYPTHVIGGFHLSSRTGGSENCEYVKDLGNYLLNTKAQYYTCHCTGLKQFEILKSIMNDKIMYLQAGSEIIL